jgi:hypothetical protein
MIYVLTRPKKVYRLLDKSFFQQRIFVAVEDIEARQKSHYIDEWVDNWIKYSYSVI